jgi:hypothetical protein
MPIGRSSASLWVLTPVRNLCRASGLTPRFISHEGPLHVHLARRHPLTEALLTTLLSTPHSVAAPALQSYRTEFPK